MHAQQIPSGGYRDALGSTCLYASNSLVFLEKLTYVLTNKAKRLSLQICVQTKRKCVHFSLKSSAIALEVTAFYRRKKVLAKMLRPFSPGAFNHRGIPPII